MNDSYVTEIKVQRRARVSSHYAEIEYAALDEDGKPRFGFEASVYISRDFEGEWEDAAVKQGAIGTHSPEDGFIRANLYLYCANLAREINEMSEGVREQYLAGFGRDRLDNTEILVGS
jgi:hypothetical protein